MKEITTLGKLNILVLLAILFFSHEGVRCQASQDRSIEPEHVTALSAEDIFRIGITTNNLEDPEDLTPIDVFADPELSEKIGTIANHTIVRYDRLSVLAGKPYWAAHPANRLPDGEKFKIYSDSITGWIDDVQLMTFLSQLRQREFKKCFAVDHINTVCLYSSGQHETLFSTALTVWEWTRTEKSWVLRSIRYRPVLPSSFSWPAIDGLVRCKDGSLAIQISRRGGDEADRWGAFVFYFYRGEDLIKSSSKHYNYMVDRDYVTLDCELMLNEIGEPIVLMIQNHFLPDDPNISGYEPILESTDTSVVNLIEEAEEQ